MGTRLVEVTLIEQIKRGYSRAMSSTSPMSPARGAATLCAGDVGDVRDIAE